MFKNLYIFKLKDDSFSFLDNLNKMEEFKSAEMPPGLSDHVGWVPFFEDSGSYVHETSGLTFFKIRIQSKKVPASLLKDEVKKHIKKVFKETGEKIKASEAKEVVYPSLLKKALTDIKDVMFYYDRDNKILVVDSSSEGVIDKCFSLFHNTFGEFPFVNLKNSLKNPSIVMDVFKSKIVNNEKPYNTIDFEDSIKIAHVEGGSITFSKEEICTKQVVDYLNDGRNVKTVGLNWNGRISFKVEDKIIFKSVKVSEEVKLVVEESLGEDANEISYFDATAFILKNDFADLLDDFEKMVSK